MLQILEQPRVKSHCLVLMLEEDYLGILPHFHLETFAWQRVGGFKRESIPVSTQARKQCVDAGPSAPARAGALRRVAGPSQRRPQLATAEKASEERTFNHRIDVEDR